MSEEAGAAFGALDATVQTADNQPEADPAEQAEAEQPAPAEDEKASD